MDVPDLETIQDFGVQFGVGADKCEQMWKEATADKKGYYLRNMELIGIPREIAEQDWERMQHDPDWPFAE